MINFLLSGAAKNFSVKGQAANILGFAARVVSAAAIQFCCGSTKAAIGNIE